MLQPAAARDERVLALLIGAAAEKIEQQIAGSVALERAGTLERAVEIASQRARRAMSCCWRRRARASTSLKITNIAGAFLRNWCGEQREQRIPAR